MFNYSIILMRSNTCRTSWRRLISSIRLTWSCSPTTVRSISTEMKSITSTSVLAITQRWSSSSTVTPLCLWFPSRSMLMRFDFFLLNCKIWGLLVQLFSIIFYEEKILHSFGQMSMCHYFRCSSSWTHAISGRRASMKTMRTLLCLWRPIEWTNCPKDFTIKTLVSSPRSCYSPVLVRAYLR